MIHERMIELDVLMNLINQLTQADIKEKDGKLVVFSHWGDEYNLTQMQERANELIKEFMQPYVIDYDSKE